MDIYRHTNEFVIFSAVASIHYWLHQRILPEILTHSSEGLRRAARSVTRTLLFAMPPLFALSCYHRLIESQYSGFAVWLKASVLLWSLSLLFGCATFDGIRFLRRLFTGVRNHEPIHLGRREFVRGAGLAAVSAPFAFTGFGTFIGRTDFQIREVEMPVAGLHPDLAGLKLVQLSDIHLSPFLSERELERVVDAANEQRADLMLVTGDLISTTGDPLDACLRQLSRLRSPAGIFGCLGNHEIYANAEDYATRHGERLGIRFLRGQHEVLGYGSAKLNLAGVDYQRIAWNPDYLPGAEKMVRPEMLNILLSHNPDVFPVAAKKGFDITLSGHTHGGQVTVEILQHSLNIARFYTPFVAGQYRLGSAQAYVNRGVGTIGIPARLGSLPEIAVIRLQRA